MIYWVPRDIRTVPDILLLKCKNKREKNGFQKKIKEFEKVGVGGDEFKILLIAFPTQFGIILVWLLFQIYFFQWYFEREEKPKFLSQFFY